MEADNKFISENEVADYCEVILFILHLLIYFLFIKVR